MPTDTDNAASRLVLALPASWLLLAAAGQTPLVLVLYSNSRLLPANVEVDRGLREAISNAMGWSRVPSFLDAPRLVGEAYLAAITRFLVEKYATRPPTVVAAGG